MRISIIGFIFFLSVFIPQVSMAERQDAPDPLIQAMQAELKRAQQGLKLPEQPDPYFIAFWVEESAVAEISGKNGAVTHSNPGMNPFRIAGAQVRVGSYRLDNTNLPMKMLFSYEDRASLMEDGDWSLSQLPVEGSDATLRATFWLLSDVAYKRAIANYQKKKVYKATAVDNDNLDDFYQEKPSIFQGPVKELSVDTKTWEENIRTITGQLSAKKWIIEPSMNFRAQRGTYYYVNTEGSLIRLSEVYYSLSITAWTRTKDGMRISNYRHFFVRDPKELPDRKKLVQEAEALAKELSDLSEAEEFKPYTGPAILMPDAAGVFFHEALGHRLEGDRQRATDSGYTFRGKVGEKVLPDFLSVSDDPTLERFNGKSLVGHYLYDDEAVPAQKVSLVEKGVLKNYLLSRTPVKGFTRSNGHGRRQSASNLLDDVIGRMASLKIDSEKTLEWQKLKAALIEEAKKQGKPYGLIIKRVWGGETNTRASYLSGNVQSFRATPVLVYAVDVETGKEKLVRGVELVGTPLMSLERVIATGNEPDVYNATCGAESGWIPVSVISPAILTSQVELQRIGGNPKKPPILPSPFQTQEAALLHK